MSTSFTLREMAPTDGPAVRALSDQSVDTGAVGFHNLYHHDPYATILALHENACGVVAEAPDHEGIVGLGMMSLGECQYEGSLRPFAYLFSLSVHPAYRRRGIASALANWRAAAARERSGPDCLIFAGIQGGNTGSQRTASRWSNQSIDGRVLAATIKMRSSPPNGLAPRSGLEIRPAEPDDYEEIAARQNAFYAGFNLYPPRTAQSLAHWHALAPFGTPIRSLHVLRDPQGNLVAGASVTEEGRLITIEVQRLSPVLKAANAFIHIFPPDGKLKRLHVKELWHAPGQETAGRYLWESLRWLLRASGSLMMIFIDGQSSLAGIVRMPWYMPKQSGSLVLSAPQPLTPARPLYLVI